jgi:starvation-inducible DNA-binding protein
MTNLNIGLQENHATKIADGLSHLLADSYTLYLKTHNYHWNVTGPMFTTLHQMFEDHYTEMATAVDDIAERIRIIGHPAPGSYKQFSKLTSIEEEDGIPSAHSMISNLLKGHETVVRTAKSILPAVDEANDEGTLALLSSRIELHEKTAWMLRSMLAE